MSDRDAVLAWLATNDALLAARRLVRRYSLQLEPEDLVSQTRVTLIERMSRRTAPLVGMESQGALYNYSIGSSRIAQLDPARNRYFKINNGPYVGDRCRDVQYSPLWENVAG